MISTDGHNNKTIQQLQPIQPRSPQNVVTDLISSNLSSRLIPKIGSIVKRFSLNYSGEGLVTDPQRVRTVRVGIRFQVQVDSFLNNNRDQNQRPRAITRTNSAPIEPIEYINNINNTSCDQNNRGYCDNSSSTGNIGLDSTDNNSQLALEYSPRTSPVFLRRNCSSAGNLKDHNSQSDIDLDSSSGVSSLAGSQSQSPVVNRRHSSSLAFHNRINQALTLCRNQLAVAAASRERGRRASVQVYRRGSVTPEKSPNSTISNTPNNIMEDSSSYQVLRYFPGSNINSAREFSWETAAFEKDVKDRVQWLGDKFSSLRIPPFVSRILSAGKTYALENPISALLIITLAIACSLPISIFLGFAVATILLTFLGFLLVEGTLLTVATFTFGGVVLIVGLVTLAITLFGFLGYFTTSHIYSIFTGRSTDFKTVLQQLPIIGNFFKPSSRRDVPIELHSKSISSNGTAYKMSNGHVPVFQHMDDDDDDEDEAYEEDDSTIEEEDVEDQDDEGNGDFVSANGDEVETESPDKNLIEDFNHAVDDEPHN